MLPNFNDDDDDVLFRTQTVKITKNGKQRQLMSIPQWTSAFDIFISIYYDKFPPVILSLIKYGLNIRVMSNQFGFPVAKAYDESFRNVRKVLHFGWAVVNDDLWRTAFYVQAQPKCLIQ